MAALEDIRSAGRRTIVPTTVLAETMVSAARYSRQAMYTIRDMLSEVFGPTRLIDDEVAAQAASLRAERRSLRLPDALVIAVGIVDDAETILTGDKRWNGIDSRIRIISN